MGGLFLLIIGVIMVTSEFQHQTATATFLATPARRTVVIAKIVAAAVFATLFWLITTAIGVGSGAWYLHSEGLSSHLGTWSVQRAILFNLMVFGLWAVLGIGAGALIRNQTGALVTTAVLYTVGFPVVQQAFYWISHLTDQRWIIQARVALPSEAALIFTTSGIRPADSPPYWVGGLVLLAYGAVSAAAGMWILRVRDIS